MALIANAWRLLRSHDLWQMGWASAVHAANIPSTNRSHFEDKDVIKSGGNAPYADKIGRLARGVTTANLDGPALSLPILLLLRGGTTPDNFYTINCY